MKTSILASLLFGIAIATDAQVPLKDKAAGWFDKAKSYIPSVTPSINNPVDVAAAAVAALKVQKVNIRNYQRILSPKLEGEEEWLIYATGANKSCFNRCGRADTAWNASVPLLSAVPRPAGAPSLHLGKIDCEVEGPLCAGLAIGCPSVYHFIVPQVSAANAKTPARYVQLNISTVAATDIVKLASQAPGSEIMDEPVYEGAFHPVDGWVAKLGIMNPLGYVINFMGTTPSWIIMIALSFFSRQFMSRRINQRTPYIGDVNRQAQAAPAAAPAAAAPRAAPGSAGKGGKKRR